MKYVIYLRVSTDKQDERTQEQKCLEYLRLHEKEKFQYMLFTDKISSRKALNDRTGMQGALNALERGDVLVALRTDRLARNLYETTCIINLLEEKKAEIVLIDQPGIKNKVLLGLYAGMAEEEGKMIRKRIKEKLQGKKMRNERVSYKLPYGYELDMENLIEIKQKDGKSVLKPGLLLPLEDEQTTLLQMCRLFDEGNSYRKIAQQLEMLGCKNRSGKPFQSMSVYRILVRTGRTRSLDQPQEGTECHWSRAI